MRIPLFHADAFASSPFRGNPAAICLLDVWLDDRLLRKVAAEINLSETAFLVPCPTGYELRWFSSRGEVRLCGHATLAAACVLFRELHVAANQVSLQTRHSGTLSVSHDGELFSIDLPARSPRPCPTPPADLIPALGAGNPVEVLEANDTYFVVYESESLIQNIRPDFSRLQHLHPHTVSVTAPGQNANFVSRYFKPSYGMNEDPVTGSAHCALVPYWSRRLRKSHLRALQLSDRGGELWCELANDRVILKGHVVLTLRGTLHL